MTEFWEKNFQDKQAMWGEEPADCTVSVLDLFKQSKLHKILVPGFGYGRNAKPFIDSGFNVTGIEISETAIELAKKRYGDQVKVYHGSVNDMPFDQKLYDGVFCYALIHLLDDKDRMKLIQDCYSQIRPDGYMVFVAISTSDDAYGEGQAISPNRFETKHGVQLSFYDLAAIEKEFGKYGFIKAEEINEPAVTAGRKPSQKFWFITCRSS